MTMKKFAIIAVAVGCGIIASPASAAQDKVTVCHKPGTPAQMTLTFAAPALQAHLDHGDTQGPCGPAPEGTPSTSVVVDAENCKAHVTVSLPGQSGVQINVDNHGVLDDDTKMNNNGDFLNLGGPGVFVFNYTLPKGTQHVLSVVTANPRVTFDSVHIDCRNPLEPTVVEVPGPERVVTVPGPVRVVQKVRAGRCYAAKSKRTGKRVLVCPKHRKHKKHRKARRHAKVRLPGTVVHKPSFTG